MAPSKLLLLCCFVSVGLLCALVRADNHHAVAVVPTETSETTEKVCSADGECTAPAATTAIFEPTHEWKVVQPHEAIPGGLHVRINLQTGLKEAKLLDKEDVHPEKTDIYHKETISSDDSGAVRNEKGEIIGESLYNALAQLPEPPEMDGMNIHEAYGKLTKEQFSAYIAKLWAKRQEELKEATASIRDEAKYMQGLIDTLVTPSSGDADIHEANVVDALQHLEWEVQDLDKAKDFNTMGGLEATVQYLNASSYRVRTMAAWVVGSAVKHYDQAQEWALQAGAMPLILNSLSIVPNEEDRASVLAMQKKMLYALSALVQANTKAQSLFARNDGVVILSNLLKASDTPLQHKIIVLAQHLLSGYDILERAEAEAHPLHAIQQNLRSQAFCELTLGFIHSSARSIRHYVDAVDLMLLQVPHCTSLFATTLRPTITSLNQTWFEDSDLDNEFKAESMRKLTRLSNHLNAL
ncbi:unnamed protein product [Aphanomyces euteiches]|uniref:Nucleotide exchange factor SIL1 n=1 Tax=Aphanomyces euteiches TaxID=100861 RepID=A0A6G0XBA7_9STRA|nr:hypothetical protein Ae201684_006567 [Aphanomyces euteiches]KAH9091015.1 hypothetical protein Ae201684P_006416 [Aphanomyces euteiches]KAH9139972.1 hypothetical protein AeRB84_015747 [Aphanomyces euteiches]